LATPEEAACLGTPSSKVLSSKLANHPPSACSETRQLLRQRRAADFLEILLAKRMPPLPLHKPAYSEPRLDSRLLSPRLTLLEVEPASLVAHLYPRLVQHHPVHNPSGAPYLVAPWALLRLGGPLQAPKGYKPLLRNPLRQISLYSPSSPHQAHQYWRHRRRRKSTC
jgi:hypothetical protein